MTYQSDIPLWKVKGKKILVRADLNVPRNEDGTITDDFRLQSSLPTLDLIKSKGGISILLTHCGRPKNKEENLSTKIFVPWFEKHNFKVVHCCSFEELHRLSNTKKYNLIIFENLRFFKGEITNNSDFAHKFYECGDYFVQDAAAALHREHASIVALPHFFDKHKKTIGFLVEKELAVLDNLLKDKDKPFLLILGGNKVSTKLPLIDSLLDKADAIFLCPALVFTFLKAQNKQVGNSLVDEDQIDHAKTILKKAHEKKVDIIFPIDYQVTSNTFEKPFPVHIAQHITPKMTGISIGPETVKLFKHCIEQASLLFFNGISGNEAYPETVQGIRSIFNTLQQTAAKKIITGGDSIALARSLRYSDDMAFFLTGGGSTLTYLSGKILHGLSALS